MFQTVYNTGLRPPHESNVLITGAGRGIGKRLAIGLARLGYRIGLLGRSRGELESTRFEIEDNRGIAISLKADVRDFDQVEAAVATMAATLGRVHALVANAAVQGPIGPFAASRPEDWAPVLDTNVTGVLNCCRAVLPTMIERRCGKIVVVSGLGATNPRPDFAVFAASKAAMAMFVESLAEEVRESNVQVNSMFPGEAYTSMTDEILEASDRISSDQEVAHAGHVRLTGGVSPEKQTQLAAFLVSERSNHVTGKLIHVQDDWRRLENDGCRQDAYTVRRHFR
jgi:3-oxoacyl-[acyl-carrier protein] reductase